DPNFLMAVMAWETAETFSPTFRNGPGSGVGLIQFQPSTAKQLGTNLDVLAAMTAEQQLVYVGKYFAPFAGRLHSLQDLFLAVLNPAAIGSCPNAVLFDSRSRETKQAYKENSRLDLNGDGVITVREATESATRELNRGLSPSAVGFYFGS